MISSDNFKKALRDLTILTGKGLTIFGARPSSNENHQYAIDVYFDQLCHHEEKDIVSALKDKDMIKEVCAGYSLNINIMEKYIQIHRHRRSGKKIKQAKAIGEFKKMPQSCVDQLQGMGIDVSKLASDKAL